MRGSVGRGMDDDAVLFAPVRTEATQARGLDDGDGRSASAASSSYGTGNVQPRPGLIMGVVARGKKAAGRDETSGYKFGDFTRELFSSS